MIRHSPIIFEDFYLKIQSQLYCNNLTANDVCEEGVANVFVGVVAVAMTVVVTLSSMLKMSSSS